ncbi:autotransporter domain-containing protein [Pseudomonas sp.]|uniref:autotransporter domain-containing protein n=1 Tax=unclassified Pseudomonas TaxID=196821 RepID=UPI003BAFBF4B
MWQRVELDDYVESNRNFTAMGYYDQKVDSTVGRIGWQVRLRVSRFEPYAQITYDQEFEGSKQANAWLKTVPGAGPYRVPGLAFDRYYVTALLGGQVAHGGAVSLRKGSIVFKQVHFLRAEPSGNDLGLERDQRVQRPHHTEDNCHALTAPWTDLKLLLFLRARARCPGKQVALIGV